MENKWLHQWSINFKIAIVSYLILLTVGFSFALLQGYDKTQLNHAKTITYYQGGDSADSLDLPKPYSHILAVMHVHAFTIPLVFFSLWILLGFVPTANRFKGMLIVINGLGILIYNFSPWLVRYGGNQYVYGFTIGGGGMFLCFGIIAATIFYEIFWGIKKV
ncbi:MAG: hypothetical protein HYU97_07770 [Deltaproteobacteria bacterium]|nr:hypothetical protein [Deltaproteobacteria bacterium]